MSAKTKFTQAIEELDRETDVEARKRFDEKRTVAAFPAARAMVAGFWHAYFSGKACREGVPGLFRAVNAGMFHFLTYAKHWELERSKRTGA